jgi:CRISPR-associated endonuclease Csn1
LVNICEFEGFRTHDKTGKIVFVGPRVAPRSSPVFQFCNNWENVNNITLKNKNGHYYQFSAEEKLTVFNFLQKNERLTGSKLLDLLKLRKSEGWYYNKQLENGIKGNTTFSSLAKILGEDNEHLKFELSVVEKELVDKETGEITGVSPLISIDFENQPLYRLWHTIYSISDLEECSSALIKNFRLSQELAVKLAAMDFTKAGFGNKSVKAIRKILPYLMDGDVYSMACARAGFNHSDSLTREENMQRQLADKLKLLSRNSLRQPVVEKILNQMINLVNAVIEKYGRPDEIRVERARELKQSKDERNNTFRSLTKRERENEIIRKRLLEAGIRATRNNVIKYRLFNEINGEEGKLNATCVYCGQPFGFTDAMLGSSVDVEHIIPKALLFDDSQSNKTLSHRICNENKSNQTAYDFMAGKGAGELELYINRVDDLYKRRIIGKGKRDKLLMSQSKIPADFIARQMRESQYISRKAREILSQVCLHVHTTGGAVTEFLRRLWGWDDVLMQLHLPKNREMGLTKWEEWSVNGQAQRKEIIADWSKRNDHRHHAIDALVVACTKQGYIQRINNLSSQGNRDQMYSEINGNGNNREGLNLLERYFVSKKPFTTAQVAGKVSEVLVSFKAGKKVATFGVRKVRKNGRKITVQKGIVVPRGALSEESVYGKIVLVQKDIATGKPLKQPLKYLFANPHLIFKAYIRQLVEEHLQKHEGDVKKALSSLKREPIFLDEEKTIPLEYASCFANEFVIKYSLSSLKPADTKFIIDDHIKKLVEERFEKFKGNEKEAFKEPLWFNREKGRQIRSVRMLTGLSNAESVKKDALGKDIGFVKPGNNHHIAFYKDEKGNLTEHVCTFWHAVERKKYGIPVVIKDTSLVWSTVLEYRENYPAEFLEKLPLDGWVFQESLQQNEMFIIGLSRDQIIKACDEGDKKLISDYLYRVQKIAGSDYNFRKHLETKIDDSKESFHLNKIKRIRSFGAWIKENPIKVRIDCLGSLENLHSSDLLRQE